LASPLIEHNRGTDFHSCVSETPQWRNDGST
jgi:hypothetical protein